MCAILLLTAPTTNPIQHFNIKPTSMAFDKSAIAPHCIHHHPDTFTHSQLYIVYIVIQILNAYFENNLLYEFWNLAYHSLKFVRCFGMPLIDYHTCQFGNYSQSITLITMTNIHNMTCTLNIIV